MHNELERRYHDKLSHISYSHDKWQNGTNDKHRHDDNSKQVANTSSYEWYSNHCPEKDLHGKHKVPSMQTAKDFNPVICMEQNPSICTMSAGAIQKMQAQQTRWVSMLKNEDMMHILMTVIISAVGTNPQANMSLPCQAMGKSTTNQAMAAEPLWIIISAFFLTLQKRGGWSRLQMWVISPQNTKHL